MLGPWFDKEAVKTVFLLLLLFVVVSVWPSIKRAEQAFTHSISGVLPFIYTIFYLSFCVLLFPFFSVLVIKSIEIGRKRVRMLVSNCIEFYRKRKAR